MIQKFTKLYLLKGIIPLWFIVFIPTILKAANNSQLEKNILVVYTYSATNTAYKMIQSGIVAQLDKEYGENYNLHLEYLELDRFTDDESIEQHIDHLNCKYTSIELDLLVCIGVDLVRHLKRYSKPNLLDLPCINFDFDLSRFGIHLETHLNDKTTYLGLDLDIGTTISNAVDNFLETDTIYFISGSAPNDIGYKEITEYVIQKEFPNLILVPIIDLSMGELLVRVKQLPKRSIILFASYNSDGNGTPFYNNDAIKLIGMASDTPIIGYSDLGFGMGVLGGKVLSFDKAGILTGKVAIDILKGKDPNSIKFLKDDYYTYQFDWRELQHHNIDESLISPSGYTLVYKSQSFIEKNRWLICGLVLFIAFQTTLIITLISLFRKQKLMISQIQETKQKLSEFANEDRVLRVGQLGASLSHELIQPLAAILNTAQAGVKFINKATCDPQIIKEVFDNIIEDVKRTTSILRSIMGMMKIETRDKEKTNLNLLIQDIVRIYQVEATNFNVRIIVNLTTEPIFIVADKVQVQQVILNLLTNATQAMEDTCSNERFINLTESIDSEYANISICDNGKGIDQHIMDNLYKPFVTTKKNGVGIGLSICRSIISDHQGEISVENLPEKGAKFTIKLKTII